MPSKNALKIYVKGAYYHLYNRGINKGRIFKNDKDHVVFLKLLKEYLLPLKHPELKKMQRQFPRRRPINCYNDVKLLAYCLMPNHFHLFLQQKSEKGIINFMKALSTSYAMYFNDKYDRIGTIFQGPYRAVLIDNDAYLLHISRYIHNNPAELSTTRERTLYEYPYSSYAAYLGKWKNDWLHTEMILSLFNNKATGRNSYQEFVEEYNPKIDKQDIEDYILE